MVELQNPEVLRAVLDSLRTGVVISDRNGTIVFWNEGAEHIAGFARHDVIGRSYHQNILHQCQGRVCKDCTAECPFSLPYSMASQWKGVSSLITDTVTSSRC